MAKLELSAQITCAVNCDDDNEQLQKVAEYLNEYPILKQAVLVNSLVCQGYMAQKQHIYMCRSHDVLRVGKLIDRVNPQFPSDSFSITTLLSLLTTVILEDEEIDIIGRSLPDYNGSRKIRINATQDDCTITFGHSMKHSGMYYEVSFSGKNGLCYPITVQLTTYTDMDNLANHLEWDGLCGCPQRIQKWICPHCQKECGLIDSFSYKSDDMIQCYDCEKFTKFNEIEFYGDDDCDCESQVAFSGEMTVKDNFDAEVVGRWLEEYLFENQK